MNKEHFAIALLCLMHLKCYLKDVIAELMNELMSIVRCSGKREEQENQNEKQPQC